MRRGMAPNRGFLIVCGMGLLALLWAAPVAGPAMPLVLASPPATQDRIAASLAPVRGQLDLPALLRDPAPGDPGPADPASGGQTQISFEHLARAQGLVGAVYWIMQDRLGFLWIGTSDGLSRYDGHTFKTYRQDPDDPDSLTEDHVFNVAEDPQGQLWVATYGGGLDRFDRDRDRFVHYQYDPDDPHSLSHNKVFCLYLDRADVLWVGTSGGGLDRYDPEIDGFVHYRHDPGDPASLADDYVNVIYEDRSGSLWIGTTDGLDRFDRQTGQFHHYAYDAGDPHSLSNNQVFAVLEDHLGALWVGTSGGGLNRLDRETGHFTHYRHDPADPDSLSDDTVFVLLEDSTGMLWVASMGGGLHRFDRENERFIRYRNDPEDPASLSSDSVNALFEDREGTLWIGTTAALDKYARQKQRFDRFLDYEFTQALLEDRQGSVWIGTTGGLYQLDAALKEVAHYQHDPDDPGSLSKGWVEALYEDRNGVLWVGTSGGGLNRLDRETGRFVHYQHDPDDPFSLSNDVVNEIYEDSTGTLWVGTDGGLNQFDHDRDRWHVWPTDPAAPRAARIESISSILQDSRGTLWVGAWGDGLKRLDREIGQFVPYRHASDDPKSLKTNFVTSVFEDSAGRLWVGTDGGLHRFESAEDGFRYYGEAQGFPGSYVGAMAEDAGGDMWIGTSFGLARFDPGAGVFKNYDIEYGLHGGSYAAVAWRRRNGEMLFGGADGIVVFFPGQIQSNAYVPPVRLTALRQNGTNVVLDQALERATALTFSGTQRDFEFDFAALSYVQPEGNRHAYMLEGYDQAWNYIGTNRTGRYTSLPGGNYTLRLKGANNDGVWNEEGTALTVTIVPPFWATWWFRGAVVLTLIGGVFVGYRLRIRSIETRSRELEQLVEARTFELSSTNERLAQEIAERERAEQALAQQAADAAVSAERSRLARELHDAVTQTLFSANLLAEALPEIWEIDQEEGRQLLRELQQLGRGALAEMRTLLLELRPAVLMDVHLGDLLRQLAEAVTGRTGVPVEVAIEGDGKPGQRTPALPAEVHIALYRIAQEALNNVVKHAGASQMSVRMHCSACAGGPGKPGRQRVELSVYDNGSGFDPDRVPGDCLGLGIIRERADAIGADLQIDSRPGEGTRVTVLWEEA